MIMIKELFLKAQESFKCLQQNDFKAISINQQERKISSTPIRILIN